MLCVVNSRYLTCESSTPTTRCPCVARYNISTVLPANGIREIPSSFNTFSSNFKSKGCTCGAREDQAKKQSVSSSNYCLDAKNTVYRRPRISAHRHGLLQLQWFDVYGTSSLWNVMRPSTQRSFHPCTFFWCCSSSSSVNEGNRWLAACTESFAAVRCCASATRSWRGCRPYHSPPTAAAPTI